MFWIYEDLVSVTRIASGEIVSGMNHFNRVKVNDPNVHCAPDKFTKAYFGNLRKLIYS